MQVLDFIMTKLPYLLIMVGGIIYMTYDTIKTVYNKKEKVKNKVFSILLLVLTYVTVFCIIYYLW